MMKNLITRLFRDTPAPADAGTQQLRATLGEGAPFLECQLTLRNGHGLAGILTTTTEKNGTEEGLLRMISQAKGPTNAPVILESYFGYEDVVMIGIGREVPRGANTNRPIILAPH